MATEQREQAVPVVRRPRSRRRFVLTEVALLGSLYAVYTLFRNVGQHNLERADDFAHSLVNLERLLAVNLEPTVNQWVDAHAWIAVPLCFWYASLHYLVTPGVLVLMARKRPDLYGSARTSIVLATLVALILYWLLPTTPPRLLGVGSYIDTMEHYANWGWWGNHAAAPGPAQWTNEYAAFPSMHAGWAIWVAIQLTRMYPRRWPAVLGWLYFLGTSFVVVATGNHYVIDIAAGAGIMVAAHLVSIHVSARRQMWGNSSGDGLIDLRADQPAAVAAPRSRLDRCREPGPVDLRGPRRRELDRFLDQLPDSLGAAPVDAAAPEPAPRDAGPENEPRSQPPS
jgi:hypothetical protein